nr:hypothetical protein [uncultured Pseudodesulfovibrio sp.]
MRFINISLSLLLLFLAAGCAVRGPVGEARNGNRITYTAAETGQSVIVELGSDYAYDSYVERSFMGTEFRGYLFRAKDASVILVSMMSRAEFEDLIGFRLDAPAKSIKSYPPKTIFQSHNCKLVRTYVTTLDMDVISAVKLQTPTTDETLCSDWTTLDEVMVERFDMLADFDKSADDNIHMIIK